MLAKVCFSCLSYIFRDLALLKNKILIAFQAQIMLTSKQPKKKERTTEKESTSWLILEFKEITKWLGVFNPRNLNLGMSKIVYIVFSFSL